MGYLMYFCRMKNESKGWVMLLVLALIWGSSFILMKKGMFASNGKPNFTDVQVASMRMFFAALVLVPMALKGFKQLQSVKDFLLLMNIRDATFNVVLIFCMF